ncbi:MAG TPA: D-alanine--D-alanine ligase A, partial [Acidobacteria bacterium]|nr:D-alanine--D-alanine ligase A [Acidobacteriota bacterium]
IRQSDWTSTPDVICEMIASELSFPVFVKPANLGSSVGISKVTSANNL